MSARSRRGLTKVVASDSCPSANNQSNIPLVGNTDCASLLCARSTRGELPAQFDRQVHVEPKYCGYLPWCHAIAESFSYSVSHVSRVPQLSTTGCGDSSLSSSRVVCASMWVLSCGKRMRGMGANGNEGVGPTVGVACRVPRLGQ